MNDAKNENVLAFDAINNDVLTCGEAARPAAEILIAGASGVRKAGEKKEPVDYRVNQPGCDIHAAAFLGNIKPSLVQVDFNFPPQRSAPLLSVRKLSYQTGAASLPHFGGQLPHGFLRDDAAFAAGKGRAGPIKRSQKLQAAAFAFFPQRKCFLYRLFLTMQPPALYGTAGKCLLVWRKLDFHRG
jgi:hypothetical protein